MEAAVLMDTPNPPGVEIGGVKVTHGTCTKSFWAFWWQEDIWGYGWGCQTGTHDILTKWHAHSMGDPAFCVSVHAIGNRGLYYPGQQIAFWFSRSGGWGGHDGHCSIERGELLGNMPVDRSLISPSPASAELIEKGLPRRKPGGLAATHEQFLTIRPALQAWVADHIELSNALLPHCKFKGGRRMIEEQKKYSARFLERLRDL